MGNTPLFKVHYFNIAENMLMFVNCWLHDFGKNDFVCFMPSNTSVFSKEIAFSIAYIFHFEEALLVIKCFQVTSLYKGDKVKPTSKFFNEKIDFM